MMVVLLIAGIGVVLAGLLGIGFGIQIKEFSFGNTLIVSGTVAACGGMIMLSLWAVARELKNVAQWLGAGVSHPGTPPRPAAGEGHHAPGSDGVPFGADARDPGGEETGTQSPAPWQEEVAPPEPAEPAPPVRPKRNLLFSSSSRKERERAEARTIDPSALDMRPAPVAAAPAPEPPPATFDDAWPQSERARTGDVPPPRRSVRAPSTFSDSNAAAPAAERYAPPQRPVEAPPVTVLKSGVVDGMDYSLYSDGSIEAQMPEGMMRFASIDELRSHLDQRQ